MKWTNRNLLKFTLLSLYFFVFVCTSVLKVNGQIGTYSPTAQKILDDYNSIKTEDDVGLDVFKFKINNILNSEGDIVEKPAGNPSIFGRTDYGSEFFLENELSTTYSIEIPAFVIDDLAETNGDDYYPVIRNGTSELEIDFKDLYNIENGETVTPEMGFVKLINEPVYNEADQFKDNLFDGEIVEFFIRPSDKYLTRHNSENLFFIDRPIPDQPVIAEVDRNEEENETSSAQDEDKLATVLAPLDEVSAMPSNEVKVYVTTVYVPASASDFEPTQIVMPVLADGDYNYEIEPAAAETFSDDMQVVAIPEEEAAILTKKVKAIKKQKEDFSKPKHDEDRPPALDPGLEARMNLELLLKNVQKAPSNLLSDTKKNIKSEFPNMSNELIDLIINLANSDEKFDLIQNPKEFLDNKFTKLSDPTELNLLLGRNLPQKDLTAIYNLILYQLSSDLADLGFETLKNQKIEFSVNIKNADQILDQVQLQQDVLAIASLIGSDEGNEVLSSLLIEPVKTNLDSSTKLFESSNSQKVLDQMRQFSDVIKTINSSSNSINAFGTVSEDNIPVVEINVQIDENIADTLQKKLNEDKRLNRSFQTRSQSAKLEKFDFEVPIQDRGSAPPTSPPLLAEVPNINAQELQLMAETTEATNNILNDTITMMLAELGNDQLDENYIQMASAANNVELPDLEKNQISEDFVFSNALSSAQRLREIEDIRAIFQILGIGS